MLPGGMYVLGVFIVSPEEALNPLPPKIKSVLNRLHKRLEEEKFLFGNSPSNEKLVLNYVTTKKQVVCKSFEIGVGNVKPAEFKFLSSQIKWVQIYCKYQIEQVYHIRENERDWPLKKHMGVSFDQWRLRVRFPSPPIN